MSAAPLLSLADLADHLGYGTGTRGRVKARRLVEGIESRLGRSLRVRIGSKWYVPREAIESITSSEFSVFDQVERLEQRLAELEERLARLEAPTH